MELFFFVPWQRTHVAVYTSLAETKRRDVPVRMECERKNVDVFGGVDGLQ
jgi:GTP cyclohydrolase II